MATITAYPSAYTSSTNGGNFTNPTYAYSDDTNYVTVTQTTKNTTSLIYYESFDLSAIPDGSTINSITIYGAGSWSTTSSIQSASIKPYLGTTLKTGTGTISNEPNTMTEWSASLTTSEWTLEQLKSTGSTGFRILLSNIRGNNATACTVSYDYVKVVVDYTAPTPPLKINIGGTWKTATDIKVNIGGVWKTVTSIKINIGGVWKDAI